MVALAEESCAMTSILSAFSPVVWLGRHYHLSALAICESSLPEMANYANGAAPHDNLQCMPAWLDGQLHCVSLSPMLVLVQHTPANLHMHAYILGCNPGRARDHMLMQSVQSVPHLGLRLLQLLSVAPEAPVGLEAGINVIACLPIQSLS